MSVYTTPLPAVRVIGRSGHHHHAKLDVRVVDKHTLSVELWMGTAKERYPLASTEMTPHELRKVASNLLTIADQLVAIREALT